MAVRYVLDEACQISLAGGEAVLTTPRGPLRIQSLAPVHEVVLRRLAGTPETRELLVGLASDEAARTWVNMTLDRLVDLGFITRVIGDPELASVCVTAAGSNDHHLTLSASETVGLDRFAYLRAEDGRLLLESPRARSKVVISAPAVAAMLARLAAPTSVEVAAASAGIDVADAGELLGLLAAEGYINVDPRRDRSEWREWSFHDAMFHSRSRSGRHGYPYGATYARASERDPLPAAKPRPAGDVIELATVDLEQIGREDPPFAAVLEARQSWRMPGPRALTIDELGEFLYRSARIRGRRGTEREEVSNRPYPGGGADYELEIAVLAHRVEGLPRGLYAYDPLDHVLVLTSEWSPSVDQLAADVASKTAVDQVPDAAFLVTARMGRLTYKYESIPYAVALKDVGSLFGTWYLTATAMGLAPCAIGGGDSEILASITGVPAFEEPRVGEFILNTQHPDEVRGSLPPERVRRPRGNGRPNAE